MEVLRLLWDHGPGTVREILDEFQRRRKKWAYTTVQTLLNRLREKGYLDRDERGLAHVYSARVTREMHVEQRMQELADQVGSGSSSVLVHQLVQGGRLSAKELGELRALIDEVRPARRASRSKGRRKSR